MLHSPHPNFQVAKENADVIIMDDNFSTIINVAKWGRSVYINIQKFVQFQLTVNVVALMVNFVSASFTGAHKLNPHQFSTQYMYTLFCHSRNTPFINYVFQGARR